jgi:hypothetical protein
MFTGRVLFLLRTRGANLSDKQLSDKIGISVNDIIIYEYGIKPIPQDIYNRWIKVLN